jgi:hypothetical protein
LFRGFDFGHASGERWAEVSDRRSGVRILKDSSLRILVPCYHEYGSLLMMRREVSAN